jgi:hypothetical protein
MNPTTKLHLGSAGYCMLLISLNWFRSVEYSRELGVTSESLVPVALAALLSLAIALYLVYCCVRVVLSRLESGRKVSAGRWIMSWTVALYALPLLWRQTSSSSWQEPDGAWASATGGYGHDLSSWVFLFAVLGLLLFQIYTRLLSDDQDPESDNPAHSEAALRRA